MVFVDSNLPMYVAGRDHANRAPALRFFERVRTGAVDICTSTEVLQEILYRYVALNRRDLAGSVYDLFVQLCPVVFPVTLADTDRARHLVTSTSGLGVRDAIHAAVMLNNSVTRIATFDQGFDAMPDLERVALEKPSWRTSRRVEGRAGRGRSILLRSRRGASGLREMSLTYDSYRSSVLT
jgi:predicted nucleic acid-binding protein